MAHPGTELNTKELIERFDDLKRMLIQRAKVSLGVQAFSLFLSLIEGYHDELIRALGDSDKRIADKTDENAILLGLVGATDTDIRAKLVSQSGEIRFLRQEVLDLRKSLKEAQDKNETLAVEAQGLKNELSMSLLTREKDREGSDKRLEELNMDIKAYATKIKDREAELDNKYYECENRFQSIDSEVEKRAEKTVKRAVVRLNNICQEIGESSAAFREEMEKLKNSLKTGNKKKFGFLSGKDDLIKELEPLLPSYNMLNDKVEEAVNILKKYTEAHTAPEIKAVKVNWSKLFDDLKTRHGGRASSKRLKISWPSSKMPGDFVSDQGLLLKALGAVLENAIEALPVEGSVEIKAQMENGAVLVFIEDSGEKIKPEHREMLFTPLFTTKSSHYGLGLVSCGSILKALGGGLSYEPSESGNIFKLEFRAAGNKGK